MKSGPDANVVRDLGHPNMAVRMLAMEELGREARSETATDADSPMRIALVAATKSENLFQRVHALWMLERLNRHDADAVQAARKSNELLLRTHGFRILAEQANWTDADRAEAIAGLSDSDGLVRRIAVDGLARHPSRDGLRALLSLRGQPSTIADAFLLHGVRIAIRDHIEALDDDWQSLKNGPIILVADAALGVHNERAANNIADFIRPIVASERDRLPEYAHHVGRYAQVSKVQHVLAYLEDELNEPVLRGKSLLGLARGLQERGAALDPALAERTAKLSRQLLDSTNAAESQLGIDLITTLRYRPLFANLAIVGVDRQRPNSTRIAALAGLAALDGSNYSGTLSARLADASESLELRERVAQALAGINLPAARSALLEVVGTAPARLANSIAAGLAANRDGAAALLQAVSAGKASPRLLLERSVRVKLDALKLPAIKDQIAKLTEGLPPADAAIADLLRRRAESFTKAKTDAAAGAKIFTQHCANCHQIAGQGTKIGPQLDGIGARGLERLIEDTLDPNRNVDQSFRMTTINLKSGQTLSGLVLREEGAVVILADNQGKEQRIDRSKIDSREVSSQSPMPANWADQIAEKDFNDLLAYLLTQLGGK
jgi:putative heme-binding domain-containing protein